MAGLGAVAKGGLSPRVRGNPAHQLPAAAGCGSIPACAGEPRGGASGAGWRTVYPRVCGGTRPRPCCTSAGRGLSPRVRGNLAAPGVPAAPGGSIPACAGEPCWPAGARGFATVYPRVCGGTAKRMGCRAPPAGLSPRVRGNRAVGPGPLERRRSIPACAGEPIRHRYRDGGRWVYPRVCGGTAGYTPA